ncbi:6,7-dimethyl-8-ribityllumazine synthase [Hirschia baltica]|uniref:6,7-dimethyl-8-ribityllumazine synthase n=1 Tax=Hirschia baltica (strain ATCC 49814 / DSM 5838 / IFAM 1418) TaxID=582402 RepID=C6XIX4_HIRBI|nr:6,7-dimethyl-8-ribityllumazine synthase [Hirschia baltica]ACT59069.1 6,7-dimethyl-8-ribityllumazine synthase [Hirschia baltica ATCC 49814]
MSDIAPHILIVTSRYYEKIVLELEAGVEEALDRVGATYETIEVPGAFEIPAAIRMAMDAAEFDGFIGLGCVIRGETSHYDYVCGETARAMMDISLLGTPIGFGVLTVENQDQAWVRADRKQKNKGQEIVDACVAMVNLSHHFSDVDV